jgi:L-ribulose-5-phosphate 3-epimerase
MQGRLSPPVGGKIQAFPREHWEKEFSAAASVGLSSIEWILESPLEPNPFWSEEGLARIRRQTGETGVRVDFVCADYFMESPFVRMSPADLTRNQSVLLRAIDQCAALGAKGIEIPCIDASEIRSPQEEDELAAAIYTCLEHAAKHNIEIGLETSLPPDRFSKLLGRIGHSALRANYDSGNSASLGYDSAEEIDAYGRWINNVHIKDRSRKGGSVPLGTGNADIGKVLRLLKGAGYHGDFILQGARGTDDVATARRYKVQLQSWLSEAGF